MNRGLNKLFSRSFLQLTGQQLAVNEYDILRIAPLK